MQDKEIQCVDCGKKFTWTVNDQEFYQEKGYKKPKRCKKCARIRREQMQGMEQKER